MPAYPEEDGTREPTDIGPSGYSRSPVRWLFLTGNRLVIAGGLLGVLLAIFWIADPVAGALEQEDVSPLYYLLGGLIGGNFTLLTIILSVAQLVISRQLGTPGELRAQIQATNSYRQAMEEVVDVDVAPVTPTEFLKVLLRSCLDNIQSLQREADAMDEQARRDLLEVLSDIEEHIRNVESMLSRTDIGIFRSLSVLLNTNYSQDIYQLRQLRARYPELGEHTCECLDDLVVRLQQIDVARQYLKTLYVQDELARLSRHPLYVGLPTIVGVALILRVFAAPALPAEPILLSGLVSLTVTLGAAPLAVLFAYVLRISTVARRTLAVTPFTVETQERGGPTLSRADD